jgi:hypothetical protein
MKKAMTMALVLTASHAASAQPSDYGHGWSESGLQPPLQSGIGISTLLGAGVGGFTDAHARDAMAASVGAAWDLRVTLGSHSMFAIDLDYAGTSADVNALSGSSSASNTGTLIGTSFEAAFRYNVWPDYELNPYVFVGMGYQRYDVTGTHFVEADTGIADSDTLAVFPMGAGIAYRDNGLVLDMRATFRFASESILMRDSIASTSHADLHTWGATVGAGYEF